MPGRRYHFNCFGVYLGYVDDVGHYFLSDGTYRGAISDDGTVSDERGTFRGYIDVQGQYWDEQGVHRGYFRRPVTPVVSGAGEQRVGASAIGRRGVSGAERGRGKAAKSQAPHRLPQHTA